MDNRIWHIVIQRDGDGVVFRELEYYIPNKEVIEYWEKYYEGVVVNVFVTEE